MIHPQSISGLKLSISYPFRIANTTINLEVWISPNYDTYVTDLVKECGSVSPPGRFGWFIPISMTKPIQNYFNPENMSDIKSIHWRHFRDRKFVDNFHIADNLLEILDKKGYTKQRDNQEWVSNHCFGGCVGFGFGWCEPRRINHLVFNVHQTFAKLSSAWSGRYRQRSIYTYL